MATVVASMDGCPLSLFQVVKDSRSQSRDGLLYCAYVAIINCIVIKREKTKKFSADMVSRDSRATIKNVHSMGLWVAATPEDDMVIGKESFPCLCHSFILCLYL